MSARYMSNIICDGQFARMVEFSVSVAVFTQRSSAVFAVRGGA
jgi:hypothetical protein